MYNKTALKNYKVSQEADDWCVPSKEPLDLSNFKGAKWKRRFIMPWRLQSSYPHVVSVTTDTVTSGLKSGFSSSTFVLFSVILVFTFMREQNTCYLWDLSDVQRGALTAVGLKRPRQHPACYGWVVVTEASVWVSLNIPVLGHYTCCKVITADRGILLNRRGGPEDQDPVFYGRCHPSLTVASSPKGSLR